MDADVVVGAGMKEEAGMSVGLVRWELDQLSFGISEKRSHSLEEGETEGKRETYF